jgi:hypothetical protein
MITNKDDLYNIKKRKTRLEALEERIISAEKLIAELNEELQEEGIHEIEKLEKTLQELKEIKQNIIETEEKDQHHVEKELNKISHESLLILNNEKVKIINENEKLKHTHKEREDYIKKLEDEIHRKNLEIEIRKKKESELLETNAVLEDNVKVLKSKAYGYDISKKFEIYQNKIHNEKKVHNQVDPNRNKPIEDDNLAYNLWERESGRNLRMPSKLEDLSKQKQLWIGNSTSNIEKFIYDLDASQKQNYSNTYNMNNMNNNQLSTNMRKFSPMIMNTKNI